MNGLNEPRGALIFEFDGHVLQIHAAAARAIQNSKPGSGDLQMRSLAQLTICHALKASDCFRRSLQFSNLAKKCKEYERQRHSVTFCVA